MSEISAASGQRSSNGGRIAKAPRRRHDLELGVLGCADPRTWEQAPVEGRSHHGPEIIGVFAG